MPGSTPAPSVADMSEHPEPIVAFHSVSKTYGTGTARVAALSDVSIDIRPGELTAVMGPSGSGKSTFMNLAAGLDDPTSGEVWVAGHPLHRMDDDARTMLRREHVGFVFQAFNLVPTLTVVENVMLPFELAGRRIGPDELARVDGLVTALGLAHRARHRPGELSGGQQQRVAIARALASRPRIVVADEPTGNLDSHSSREVLALLRTASREHQQTIAMVTHDPVAASYADRILVIADGRIVGDHGALTPRQISDLLISLEVGAA